jgi:LmbE family N-acetylglucosaminyl deacetylase
LLSAAAVLGIHPIRFLRYRNNSIATTNADALVSSLTKAMRRIRPDVVIAPGPDDFHYTNHIAVSNLVTSAFDRAFMQAYLPLSSRLYYLVSVDTKEVIKKQLRDEMIFNRSQ